MYELLIRIETVCVQAPLPTLLGVGVVTIVAGLLLWLAGTYFSSVIIGILGAAVGSFCGLLVSQWFDVNSLLSMGIGAGIFCVAAVLLRNIIIIVLAIIIFALAAGTAYSSMILKSPAQQQETELEPAAVSSFSRMDSTTRLSYVSEISAEQDGFFEKLKALLKDTLGIMSPYKWKLLLSTLGGGLGGLLLVWFIRKFVIALCCSIVGALLVLIGVESLLMAAGFQMCNAFEVNRSALTITYFSMVGIGAVVQLIIARSQKPKEAEAGKKKKSND
ncbi:MAG: hypothetical protein ACYSUX_06725 [Planctomycetota bacterium]|jgi:hypothetical protein